MSYQSVSWLRRDSLDPMGSQWLIWARLEETKRAWGKSISDRKRKDPTGNEMREED